MKRTVCGAVAAICLLLSCVIPSAVAGNLTRADIERMVDYYYVVGEIQPDVPVYPLFVKDAAAPDAKPELKAYVFESVDFAPSRGYSGKPINLLITLDLAGNFLKVRLLDHKEPLFLDSAGTLKLERFASQYKGLNTRHTVELGPYNDPGLRDDQVAHLKGVQQGTISVKAINRAVLTAATAVATARLKGGGDEPVSSSAVRDNKDTKETKEVKDTKESKPESKASSDDTKPLATARPSTDTTDNVKEQRPATLAEKKADLAAVMVSQDKTAADTATAKAAGSESGSGTESGTGSANPTTAVSEPQPSAALAIPDQPSARPPALIVSAPALPEWLDAWRERRAHIATLLAGLGLLSVALIAQKRFSANSTRMRQLRTLYLLFTLGFIGWTAQGQLTIVNITAAVESLATGGDLSFLMNDPMTVILWLFVGVSLLVWGRGTFCGWLCPFGALQELISLAANAVGMRQRRLRSALDARLKWIKYLILATILVSLYVAPPVAELATEIEPFKTAISLYFMRDWPYVLWASSCLLLGVFIYRGYCRYICPLGAALASVNFLQRWSWIPRRDECGKPCQTCRHRCEYQAIAPSGKVSYSECFQCLDCVAIHQDPQRCFPLIRMNKESSRAPI